MKHFRKNRRKGFSVLELLIVIIVVGILAAVARPAIAPFLEGIRLRTSANTIKQHIILAKTRALGDPNVHAGVFFQTGTKPSSSVVFIDDDPADLNDYQFIEGQDHIFAPKFNLPVTDELKVESGANPVVFRGDGSAKSSIKISITNKFKKCDTVSVLASTGRIKITKNF